MIVAFALISETDLESVGPSAFAPFRYIEDGHLIADDIGVAHPEKLPTTLSSFNTYMIASDLSQSYIGYKSDHGKEECTVRLTTMDGPSIRVPMPSGQLANISQAIEGHSIGFYFRYNGKVYATWTTSVPVQSGKTYDYTHQSMLNFLMNMRASSITGYLTNEIKAAKLYTDTQVSAEEARANQKIDNLGNSLQEQITSLSGDLDNFSGRFTVL